MRAAEPDDLSCLRGIGMMGEPRPAADGARLPVEFATLERHGDGGAGVAEGLGLGGEGAGLLGGLGVGAVGGAPGTLVAAFAAGATSSYGSVALRADAGKEGGRHQWCDFRVDAGAPVGRSNRFRPS